MKRNKRFETIWIKRNQIQGFRVNIQANSNSFPDAVWKWNRFMWSFHLYSFQNGYKWNDHIKRYEWDDFISRRRPKTDLNLSEYWHKNHNNTGTISKIPWNERQWSKISWTPAYMYRKWKQKAEIVGRKMLLRWNARKKTNKC